MSSYGCYLLQRMSEGGFGRGINPLLSERRAGSLLMNDSTPGDPDVVLEPLPLQWHPAELLTASAFHGRRVGGDKNVFLNVLASVPMENARAGINLNDYSAPEGWTSQENVRKIGLHSILRKKKPPFHTLMCHYLLLKGKWVSSGCHPRQHFPDRE